MAEETNSTIERVDVRPSVSYFVPLQPFERLLLSDLTVLLDEHHYPKFDPQNAPISSVFHEWSWAGLVKRCFNDDLGEELLHEEYRDDRNVAYKAFIHFLAHHESEQQNLARAEALQSTNEDFLLKLGDRSVKDVEFKPVEEDLQLWETLSRLYQTYGRYWKFKELFSNSEGEFDIWKLIRKFTLHWQWPHNKENVYQVLVRSPSFEALFRVNRHDPVLNESEFSQTQDTIGEFEQLDIKKRPKTLLKWPAGEPMVDDDGGMIDAYLAFLIRGLGQSSPLEDPRAYLHLIHWTDLSMVDPAFLQQCGVDLDAPFIQRNAITEWVFWTPPHPGFSWNHHIHTEDEVYEYNIVNDWAFPSHYLKDQVMFAVREVDQVDFISELRDYWNTWNDCALTQKIANGPLFLLETIPGMHFRGRRKHQDKVAALNYFRNLVEAHAANTLDTSLVRDIIGLEPGYTPLFEYSLRVIPEEQLFDISWEKPIGAGENGAVYAAMWRKPAGHLATMKTGNQELHIVLKDVIPRIGTSRDPLKKFLQELDVTYASLGGSAVGCVDFLGIALVHHWPKRIGSGKIPMLSSPEYGDRKLFLVFERATQGTVLGFLSRQLKDLTFTECWSEVADSLSSIANGINTLHVQGVLHRDLHMNNILVTDRYYPNDPKYPHQYDYMITDIGEGKVLNPSQEVSDLTYHRASYGAVEFRAPEIRGNQGWSTKAEVFSFGVIACKIMECRNYICPFPTPEWVLLEVEREHPNLKQNSDMIAHIVPAGLRRVIESCLAHSPNDRPSMGDVTDALDDLTSDFAADSIEKGDKRKVKWIVWKWNESLRESRLKFSQTNRGKIGSNDFDEFSRVPELPE